MSPVVFQENAAGITSVTGFSAAGVSCDIRNKGDGRLDLALIYSDRPCSAAGTFTTNAVKAPPVRYCQEALAFGGPFRAIAVNSGNANACTGEEGMDDARGMATIAAGALDVSPGEVFVCSTGRIGERLPMSKVRAGLLAAAAEKGSDEESGRRAARAIMTSDTRPKSAAASFEWEGRKVTVGGIAKGAGMIQPNMATMLAFIVTDAAIEADLLRDLLKHAVNLSFNRITIDGDMSTNDTVLILANGASGVRVEERETALKDLFSQALLRICEYLAEKIVSDGEKITKVVEVRVEGAASDDDAEKVARAIGNSLLVKSSWFGEDPNWGRLADAAGYSGARLVEGKLNIFYEDAPAVLHGRPLHENKSRWKQIVRASRFCININLNLGEGAFRLLTTDLTENYVRFNKSE